MSIAHVFHDSEKLFLWIIKRKNAKMIQLDLMTRMNFIKAAYQCEIRR